MKRLVYLSIVSLMVTACSSGGGDDKPEVKNTAPTVPALVAPSDNKLCLNATVVFEWSAATDANNDVITYQLQVAKDNQFTQIVKTEDVQGLSKSINLEKNTAYYWRLKSTDSKGLSSAYSSTYKFYTSGDAVVNHLPFVPELVAPTQNVVLNTSSTTLKWNATDVDATDVLTYDIYFGTTANPTTKIKENNTSKSFDVTLEPTKEYFWKIVVKDNKGGETTGQVWKFKTN
ncbi:SusE domain-containing protein [Flavobacterium sp. LM5]|jgi:hypothetical protein|uniref:SusE domain-containing protein n=1 Tax=Flavobacterium sp. LM5 TaxID=1938610 RepID=UPI000993D7F9|nr:SusE domain-containing protein [Flavobacterium sp. LM5]